MRPKFGRVFVVLEKKVKSTHLKFAAWLVVAIGVVPIVLAQTQNKKVTDQSSAKPFAFDSALDKYRPYKEQDIQSWVQANETTLARGGWRQYLKESQRARSQP